MQSNKREKVLVDKRLQHALARRIVTYWSGTWLVVFSLPILIRTFTNQLPFSQLATEIIGDFWFPIAISIFLLPIVVWDSFRFSNRIAGPVYRVNEAIREYGRMEASGAVKVREDDFCENLVDSVNELIETLDARNRSAIDQRETEKVV